MRRSFLKVRSPGEERLSETSDLSAMAAASIPRNLAQLFHHLLQHLGARTDHRWRQRCQRLISDVEHIQERGRLGIYVKNTSKDFALFPRLVKAGDSANFIRCVVILL